MKNCPNCGAPIEELQYKCPYCSTLYLNLSMIDFDNQEPFFLTIKRNGMLITQKVIPQTVDMYSSCDEVYATGHNNEKLLRFQTAFKLETNVQFNAIPMDKEKNIYAKCERY